MIDEDLYQQAADELNSDKRRPHIWARACALASDDHDEARYLYTNLRVEELLAEREAGGETAAASDSEPTKVDDQFESLSLESLGLDDDAPASVSTPAGVDRPGGPDSEPLSLEAEFPDTESVGEIAQSRNFQDSFDVPSTTEGAQSLDDPTQQDDFLDDTINLTSELDGTAVFELDQADAPDLEESDRPRSGTDAGAGISADEELEALLDGVYEGPAPLADAHGDDAQRAETADFSDLSGAHDTREEDLDWLEQELTANESGALSLADDAPDEADGDMTLRDIENTDRLAGDLERRVEDLSDQPDDVIDLDEAPALAVEILEDDAAIGDNDSPDTLEDASRHSTGESRLDSIFDSIEHEAEELRAGPANESAQEDLPPTDPTASEPAESPSFTGEDEPKRVVLPDRVDSETSHDGDAAREPAATESASDEPLPAAAVVAASGTAAGIMAESLSDRPADEHEPPDSTPAAGVTCPVDLTASNDVGAVYSVYRRNTRTQAVRHGVSWSALFLTLPSLLYRHLFGTAVIYILTWLILMTGLLVCGLSWLDNGASASMEIRAGTIGFGILAIIGLLYLPFRHANRWRRNKLEQRGFEPVAIVRDRSAGKAIAQARQADLLKQ